MKLDKGYRLGLGVTLVVGCVPLIWVEPPRIVSAMGLLLGGALIASYAFPLREKPSSKFSDNKSYKNLLPLHDLFEELIAAMNQGDLDKMNSIRDIFIQLALTQPDNKLSKSFDNLSKWIANAIIAKDAIVRFEDSRPRKATIIIADQIRKTHAGLKSNWRECVRRIHNERGIIYERIRAIPHKLNIDILTNNPDVDEE